MKSIKIFLIIFLSTVSYLCSEPTYNPALILEEINNLLYAKKDKDFKTQLGWETLSRLASREYVIRPAFMARCGCSLKGSNPDAPGHLLLPEYTKFLDTPSNTPITSDSSILKQSPNFYNSILLGDSITQLGSTPGLMYTWNKDYAPGWGIINGGVGLSDSQDVTEWLDSCASQNPNLWDAVPEQLSCDQNPKGRFACNPPPNSDKLSGYVQFQNRNVIVMIGANDFNTGIFKTLLETFPILVPFRHAHVANSLNRILTYIERQSGTRKILVGYMPLPSYYPGVGESLLSTLSRIGLFNRYNDWFTTLPDGTSVVKANYKDIPGGRTIAATASLLNGYLENILRGQDVSVSSLLNCFSTMNISFGGFCDNMRGDNSWISQRVIELNLVMAAVAQSRGASMHTLYFTFLDYDAYYKGYWYVGNRNFWTMDFGASNLDKLIYTTFTGRDINDSSHPNHLGYQAYGATLDLIFKAEKANIKQTPFVYRDGCFIEPNDPGPYEECLTKTYHEWENGACVDKTPTPPPPTIVANPNAPNSTRPAIVSPPATTFEPPPLPAADDNVLLLLAACLFFGYCHP